MSSKVTRSSIAGAAALFSFTLLFFTPLQIYLTNAVQLPFSIGDIFLPFLGIAVAVFIVLATILILLPSRISMVGVVILLALGCLIYLQGNWILWDYGTLDGRPIEWGKLTRRGLIDGALWLVGLAGAIAFRRRLVRASGWMTAGVLGIQVINLSALWMGAAGSFHEKGEGHQDSELYRFSNDKNVLFIVLDTLQSDVLQEVFDEFPDEEQALDGFTFYRNGLAGFPTTYMNVPLFMSGQYFRNDIGARDFLNEVTETGPNLPGVMKENGFRSHLIGNKDLFIANESNADIWIGYLRNIEGVDIGREMLFLVDLAAFRTFPHFLKKAIYNDQKWFLLDRFTQNEFEGMPQVENLHDLQATSNLVRNASVDEGPPVFKYIHYWTAHPPIRLNEKLEYVELPHSRENLRTYTRAALAILDRILIRLREIGAYENTLIVVTGDHGAGFHGYLVNPTAGGLTDEHIVDTTVEGRIKAGALAAVLIKEIDSSGPLQIKDTPITIGDLPAAIAGSFDLSHSFPGVEFLSAEVDPLRERYYYFHHSYHMNAGQYFDGLVEHSIRGHAWLDGSWERTDRPYPPGGRTERIYNLGERIRFDVEGNFRDFETYGFSIAGEFFTWTDRVRAGLKIRLDEYPSTDLVLRFRVPSIFGPGQRLSVWLDYQIELANWFHEAGIKEPVVFEVTIPASSIRGRQFALEFQMPDANRSPKHYKLSNDTRRLGIGVEWLEIVPVE